MREFIDPTCETLSKARRPAVEQTFQTRRRKTKPDKKSAEQAVNGAGFVEAHFINEFFKNQRIVGKKIDAPFPVIEADGSGNDLGHAAGVMAPDHAVLAHHSLALANRLAVPVLGLAAKFVHRVKAQIAALGNLWPQARRRRFALYGQLRFDCFVPFRRALLKSLRRQVGVEFYRSFVES